LSTDTHAARSQPRQRGEGWVAFASWMLILVGFFHVISGIGGITSDDVYVRTANYVFSFSSTAWGWIHLLLGVLVMAAGAALFNGAVWARTVGVVVATVSAIGTFAFLPSAPVWALVILAVDVLVIWALLNYGRNDTA
jgi:hypothetical protein